MIGAAEETREVSRRTYGDLRELVTLRSGSPFRKTKQSIAGERALTAAGRQLDIEASFRPQSATKLGLKVLVGANGDETVVGYDTATGCLYIDRTKSGVAAGSLNGFSGVHLAPLTLRDGTLSLRILIDHSIVEVFAEDGERDDGSRLSSPGESNGMNVFAEGGTALLEQITVHQMRSIWAP